MKEGKREREKERRAIVLPNIHITNKLSAEVTKVKIK